MNVRVLLVDDHDDARITLARRLQRDPRLELLGAASCLDEAASILLQAHPDIVLLDTQRRDGRGTDTCRALQKLTDAPVVAFTSFMTPELWEMTREAGATDYLLKHIDTHRLSRDILRLAERYRSRRGETGAKPSRAPAPPSSSG